jgi:hypothetical protein
MARPNYGAAKRTRELKRKAKREAKLARKHARRTDQPDASGTPPAEVQAGTPAAEGAVPRPGQDR